MGENGKGDTPRPLSVPIATYKANFDRIFRKKPEEQDELGILPDDITQKIADITEQLDTYNADSST
jgi:hypothetical protein